MDEKFELPDGFYPVSDIPNYFLYITRKYKKLRDNPLIRIYINRIENRTTLETKSKHFLKFSMPQILKLLDAAKNRIAKVKNGEKFP